MNIILFGAGGEVGSRIVREARSRGHSVTAVVRRPQQADSFPPGVEVRVLDLQGGQDLSAHMSGHDLVVSALRPPEGQEPLLVGLTEAILASAAMANKRVIVVGGAASLRLEGKKTTVLTEPGLLPGFLQPIGLACQQQYELCLGFDAADWSCQTPPMILTPGKRTGAYRLGTDTLLTDGKGVSTISMEDFAVALIDEAEQVRHIKTRYTVAY